MLARRDKETWGHTIGSPSPGGFFASSGPQIMSFGVPEAACSLTALSNRDGQGLLTP